MHVAVYSPVHTHRPEKDIRCPALSLSLPLSLQQGWQPTISSNPPVSTFHNTGGTGTGEHTATPCFCCGAVDVNSGSHACTAGLFTHKPSPQPRNGA